MARPEYLNCIMTPEIIRSITQDQECYDRDPAAYEQQERECKELQEQEDQMMREEYSRELEREQERKELDDLPF